MAVSVDWGPFCGRSCTRNPSISPDSSQISCNWLSWDASVCHSGLSHVTGAKAAHLNLSFADELDAGHSTAKLALGRVVLAESRGCQKLCSSLSVLYTPRHCLSACICTHIHMHIYIYIEIDIHIWFGLVSR